MLWFMKKKMLREAKKDSLSITPIKTITTDMLTTRIYSCRNCVGVSAAECAANAINNILVTNEFANVIFAAAPSQNEMLEKLLQLEVDFSRINAFHMDEYVGLGLESEQSFANYLTEHIFSKVRFHSVNLIPATLDPQNACDSYATLLTENPPDVVCMGIGENGHIAFNDPPVADFADSKTIKVVQLDNVCRMQQVHDGCFSTIQKVPTHALTLTVPTLMSAKNIICTVPGATKAEAVERMLNDVISEACPATILRKHRCANMFLDIDSAAKILR